MCVRDPAQRTSTAIHTMHRERKVHKDFCLGIVILLHKKRDKHDLSNYRPITLLPNIYKLFTKILTNALDENQPHEQAGFRSSYSTIDHLHAINQLIEPSLEYNKPLCLAFVDYEKAFDSVEHMAIFNAMQEQGVNENYIQIFQNIYKNVNVIIRLHKDIYKIKIVKGVRHGDTISPKLFTARLESIFRKTDWEEMGINIDGEYLRFADDISTTSEATEDLQNRLTDLNRESKKVGLQMNRIKTNVMFNNKVPKKAIKIEGEALEEVDEYIYRGQVIKLEKDYYCEVKRRIMIGWKAFGMNRDILKSTLPMCLKHKVYNGCIIPALTMQNMEINKTRQNYP